MQIIRAAPQHYRHICDLVAMLAHEEGGQSALSVEALTSQMQHAVPAIHSMVALDGDAVIGCVLAYPGYDVQSATRGWHISDIMVSPAHRRQGIGRALLAALAREGVSREMVWASWTVLSDNHDAQCFYAALGAERIDVHFMAMGNMALQRLMTA